MKKITLLLIITFSLPQTHAQFVHVIKADSVLITNDSGTAELNLENSTKHIKGFLYNKGNGRTEFRKFVKLNDTTFVMGGDTLIIGGSGASRNFANSDLTFNANHIHNGNQKRVYFDNFTYIDLKSNKETSTANSRLTMDSSGAVLFQSNGASSLRRNYIESDTNWVYIGHEQPPETGAGISGASVVILPQEWGPGFSASVASGSSGSNNFSSSISLTYDGGTGIVAKGNEANKKASVGLGGGVDDVPSVVHLRVDTTDGPAAGIWSTYTQIPRLFEFGSFFHGAPTPLDFRLLTLPISIDTNTHKPLTVDSNGKVYRAAGWPSVPLSLQQVTSYGNSTTNTIKPYPNALPIGSNNDSIVVWSGLDSLLKKIGPKQTFAQTATVTVSNTTSETTLIGSGAGSLVIPSAAWAVGKSFEVTVQGIYSTDNTNPTSITLRLKLGSTVIASSGTISMNANRINIPFILQATITCTSTGSSGSIYTFGDLFRDGKINAVNNGSSASTINTTTNQTFSATVQLSDTSSGNSLSAFVVTLDSVN